MLDWKRSKLINKSQLGEHIFLKARLEAFIMGVIQNPHGEAVYRAPKLHDLRIMMP